MSDEKILQIVWPPWKNIIITVASGAIAFRMQILSAHTATGEQ